MISTNHWLTLFPKNLPLNYEPSKEDHSVTDYCNIFSSTRWMKLKPSAFWSPRSSASNTPPFSSYNNPLWNVQARSGVVFSDFSSVFERHISLSLKVFLIIAVCSITRFNHIKMHLSSTYTHLNLIINILRYVCMKHVIWLKEIRDSLIIAHIYLDNRIEPFKHYWDGLFYTNR